MSLPNSDSGANDARALRVLLFEPYPNAHVFGNLRTLLYILEYARASAVHCVVVSPTESELSIPVRALGADWVVLTLGDAANRYGGQVLRDSWFGRLSVFTDLLRYNLRFRSLLRDRRIDVVYCNSIRALITVGLAAILARVPRVWYVKGELGNGFLDRLGFLIANRILFFCQTNRDDRYPWLVRWFSSKIDIVPIGIDLGHISSSELRSSSLDAELAARGGLSVGYVGQLYPLKGVHFLVDAFAQVASSFPDVTLYLIGDSGIVEYAEYIDALRSRISARGLQGRVVLTGWRDDALAIVNRMTVIVHPSLSEGFGRAVLESMALGKPVIASAVGGLREAVRDGQNGFLVQPGDSDALAAKLTLLLSNAPLRERLGDAARSTVRSEYQIEDKMRQLYSIWRNVAGAGPEAALYDRSRTPTAPPSNPDHARKS